MLVNGPSYQSAPTEGAEWNVKCIAGYISADSNMLIKCVNGNWNVLSSCSGMLRNCISIPKLHV